MHSLVGRHQIGELIEKLIPSNEPSYGEQALTTLTRELGLSTASNILTKIRAFARCYSANEAQQLETPAPGRHYRIGWAHIQVLSTFPRPERHRLERQCREGEWTVAELRRRVRQMRAPKRLGGRPWRKPADVDEALEQVQVEADGWLKRSAKVWRGGELPVITRGAISAGGAATKKSATVTIALLEQLAAAVGELQAELRAGTAAPRKRR